MATFNFSQHEDNGDDCTSSVSRTFDTDYLDKLVEEFYWFLRSAGFYYVEKVVVDKGDNSTVEFGVD